MCKQSSSSWGTITPPQQFFYPTSMIVARHSHRSCLALIFVCTTCNVRPVYTVPISNIRYLLTVGQRQLMTSACFSLAVHFLECWTVVERKTFPAGSFLIGKKKLRWNFGLVENPWSTSMSSRIVTSEILIYVCSSTSTGMYVLPSQYFLSLRQQHTNCSSCRIFLSGLSY